MPRDQGHVRLGRVGLRAQGAYFPWLMPLHILPVDLAKQLVALEIGAFGGVVRLALMLLHLQRREAV